MISKIYTNEKILEILKEEFEKSGILKLESFFSDTDYKKIEKSVKNIKFRRKKIPDKLSFQEGKLSEDKNKEVFPEELKKFLKKITKRKISQIKIKKFGHRDYTIIHDSEKEKTSFYFFICEKWSPDHGGNLVFREKNGKVFYITPMKNTLCLIKKRKNWQKFFQYINHLSEKKEIIIIEGNLK